MKRVHAAMGLCACFGCGQETRLIQWSSGVSTQRDGAGLAMASALLDDDDFVLAGLVRPQDRYSDVPFVARFSDAGDSVWLRTDETRAGAFRAVAPLPNGDLLTGGCSSDLTPWLWRLRPDGTGSEDLGLSGSGCVHDIVVNAGRAFGAGSAFSLDSNSSRAWVFGWEDGSVVWEDEMEGAPDLGENVVESLAVSEDGWLLLAGAQTGPDMVLRSFAQARLPAGTVSWTWSGTTAASRGTGVTGMPGGGVVLTEVVDIIVNSDIRVVGLDSLGETRWITSLDGLAGQDDHAWDVLRGSDDSIFIVGDMTPREPEVRRDIFVGEISASGEWEWYDTVPATVSESDRGLALEEFRNGDLLVSGYTGPGADPRGWFGRIRPGGT